MVDFFFFSENINVILLEKKGTPYVCFALNPTYPFEYEPCSENSLIFLGVDLIVQKFRYIVWFVIPAK